MAAMARLRGIRRWNTISFASKFKLHKSLVTSILVYGCEAWALFAHSEEKIQAFETKCPRKFLRISYMEHKTNDWVRKKINFLVNALDTRVENCQETETRMVRACHTPRQPLQNHPSGHFGGWATPWSAEEMLDGQHQRVDIPAHARFAHKGLLQKRLEEDLC